MTTTLRLLTLTSAALVAGTTQIAHAQGPRGNLSPQDRQFIERAGHGGVAEVRLGQLAQQRAGRGDVRRFGMQMVRDHSAANQRLARLSSRLGMPAPRDMNEEQRGMYRQLHSLRGGAFDEAYSKMMVDDHQEDIAEFENEARNGRNPRLKAFAAKTLPTLRRHLAMARQMRH